MKAGALIVSLVTLLGCAPDVAPTLRDPAAPMGASTRFDAQDFTGAWNILASFAEPGGTLSVARDAASGVLTLRAPQAGVPSGRYREGVQGELLPLDPRGMRLAVMWLSEDGQTAAIGAPSGGFAAILNRGGTLRADRAAAARDVLAFYGWDVARLRGPGA